VNQLGTNTSLGQNRRVGSVTVWWWIGSIMCRGKPGKVVGPAGLCAGEIVGPR
jgi:hypothetical protein